MRGSEYAELKAFAAIVRHGGFSRAAAPLRMSPSALSQTIRTLETRLGVRLLNRTTRSVAPTEAGRRLLQRLEPALAEIEAALADLAEIRDTPSGSLRINTSRIAAAHFIAPRIAEFCRRYPDVVLELAVDDGITDVVGAGFDAGIRLGERLEKDAVSVRLGPDLEMMAVASADYLDHHGTPETPEDLHGHRCINFRWPSHGGLYAWEFERDGHAIEIAVEGPVVVNDHGLMLRAVLDGVGIAYMLDQQARPWVERGRLVRVLAGWSPSLPGFHLYYPGRRQIPPALRAFVDLVRWRAP